MRKKYFAPLLIIGLAAFTNTQAQQVYCDMPDFSYTEPICQVTFAGINNVSPGDLDAPGTEDSTNLTAQVTAGQSYTLTVYGNTGGDWTNSIRAYFDWDRDGIFETAVLVGILEDSECADPVTVTVEVPANALSGTSRMRILKKFLEGDPSPNDGCAAGSSFGQAEDYTVEVSVPVGISTEEIAPLLLHPNPVTDGTAYARIAKDLPGATIEIHDLTGRSVHQAQADLVAGSTLTLPVGHLKPGPYFVSISGDSGRWTERLVVH